MDFYCLSVSLTDRHIMGIVRVEMRGEWGDNSGFVFKWDSSDHFDCRITHDLIFHQIAVHVQTMNTMIYINTVLRFGPVRSVDGCGLTVPQYLSNSIVQAHGKVRM